MKHVAGSIKDVIGMWRFLSILILILSVGTGVCLAHKINVFAIVEKDFMVVEGYFPGNVKAQDSLVEVYDSTDAKVAKGLGPTPKVFVK